MPLVACGGQTGSPAAPSAFDVDSFDATVPDATPFEATAPPPRVLLGGIVAATRSDAGVVGAFVIAEVGGLGGAAPGPDGSATTVGDPFIRYGTMTDDAGAFALEVPAGTVGIHALASAYDEGKENVQAVAEMDGGGREGGEGGREAGSARVVVTLSTVSSTDATSPSRPIATRLTPSSLFVAPLAPITFAVDLAAASPDDPLSGELFLVQPDTQWAGALAPPVPVVPGGPYPNGDYSLLVSAPATSQGYLYTVVCASMSGVTSVPVSVLVTVTPTGAPPQPDGGQSFDAGDGGELFLDGGGVPDGRH